MNESLVPNLALSLAVLALAGCQDRQAESRDAAPVPTPVEQPTAAPTATVAAIEGKSIIRPAVIEEKPAPPPIERVSLTIPFPDRISDLSDEARGQLDDLLETPVVKAGGPITLRGHSDSRGFDGDNLVASRRRAEAVRDYLADKGIAAERIEVIALGETRPIAPNAKDDGSDDPEGRALNRRVEVVVEPPVADKPVAPEPTDKPA